MDFSYSVKREELNQFSTFMHNVDNFLIIKFVTVSEFVFLILLRNKGLVVTDTWPEMSVLQTEMLSNKTRLHVLVTTVPFFGHVIPSLEFVKKIREFHDVTFAVSAGKVPELKKRELIEEGDHLEIYGIPDGVYDDYDNPDDAEANKRIFIAISSAVAKLFREIPTKHDTRISSSSSLAGILKPVDIVIVDNFLGESGAICRQRDIPYYLFNAANAIMAQLLLSIHEESPTVPDEEADPFYRVPEPGGPLAPIAEHVKEMLMPLHRTNHLANGVIVNSLRDLELDALQEIKKNPSMEGLTIHCIGPLLPAEKGASGANLETEKKVADWLDRQEASSVVYVSFGSIATPTPDQVKIIGQALLALGHPVIWSIRDKYHEFLPEEISSGITNQFNEPNGKFLVIPWAPQKLILGHSAVAVFVSHCGWNSTLEGLSAGKPIVGWPMFADQLWNMERVVKLGAGLLIPDTGSKQARIVPAKEIEDVIEKVAGWKNGNGDKKSTYQEAARIWGKKINSSWTPNGSSYKEFIDLMQFRLTK